jgi:hypothetical protein
MIGKAFSAISAQISSVVGVVSPLLLNQGIGFFVPKNFFYGMRWLTKFKINVAIFF